jgi:hypothetical protein
MTPEELSAYVEVRFCFCKNNKRSIIIVRQCNRANAKKYYDEKIKTDPEKYEKFKVKCAKASKTSYSRADYRLETS